MLAVFPTIYGANMNIQSMDEVDDDEGDVRASMAIDEEIEADVGRIATVGKTWEKYRVNPILIISYQ